MRQRNPAPGRDPRATLAFGSSLKLALAASAQLVVNYSDRSPSGTALSEKLNDLVRSAIPEAWRILRRQGMRAVVAASERLLGQVLAPGAGPLGGLYQARQRLRESCLHPSPALARPRSLVLDVEGAGSRELPLPPALWAELAAWIGDWQRGAPRPRSGPAARLWDELRGQGAFVEAPAPPRARGDVLFVGHACVRIGPPGGSVLVDPLLFPRRAHYGPAAQPLAADELAPDAVLITHSHSDHYDPGSLLRFGADCPIVVPEVERESVLCANMAERLAALGFRRVRSLEHGQRFSVGRTKVTALPFHGEQPTTAAVLHPGVRNQGNTYLIESQGQSYYLCADAGRDGTGDVKTLGSEQRRARGPANVIFGGFRSWSLYPIGYLFTSVAKYLLFVPRELWAVRQQIMNGPEDLIDTAEAWGATRVVPYANGGAPWYWESGLGPRPASAGEDNPHVDPFPERVAEAARRRSSWGGEAIPSPVTVKVLTAGQELRAPLSRARRGEA